MTNVRNSIKTLNEKETKYIMGKKNFVRGMKATRETNILNSLLDLAGSSSKSSILPSVQPVVLYLKSGINTMFHPVCFSFYANSAI